MIFFMAGSTERITIEHDHFLLRRVLSQDDNFIREDGSATSLAFKLRSSINEKGLSVDLEHLTTVEASVQDRAKYALFKLQAGVVRSKLMCVCHDPCPPEAPSNGAHSLIVPFKDKAADCPDSTGISSEPLPTLSKSVSRALAKAAVRVF